MVGITVVWDNTPSNDEDDLRMYDVEVDLNDKYDEDKEDERWDGTASVSLYMDDGDSMEGVGDIVDDNGSMSLLELLIV